MLIKTTYDGMNGHSFVGLPEKNDTEIDHDVTAIYFKIWAMNTVNGAQISSKKVIKEK